MKNIALFDLDNTLLPLDSDHAWGEFITTLGWTDPVTYRVQNDIFYEQYKSGSLNIYEYIRFTTKPLRNVTESQANLAHGEFMERVIIPSVRSSSLELVNHHRDKGDYIIMITATNDFVTRPISDIFKVDELMAVELERVDSSDPLSWVTGEIMGTPTFREGKVVRFESWIKEKNLSWADIDVTFYTDSINDLALLDKVNVPVATNPDPSLRSVALSRGWRILELFE